MAKDYSKGFYNSKSWINTQKAYKQSKFGLCERCKKPNAEIVHHKKYINEININNPDITLSWDNLELLCMACHNKEHHKKHHSINTGLCFDVNGNVVKQ